MHVWTTLQRIIVNIATFNSSIAQNIIFERVVDQIEVTATCIFILCSHILHHPFYSFYRALENIFSRS